MKSRVANRIFYLFIICALLPIGLLAFISLDQLSKDITVLKFKTNQANLDLITEIDVTIPLSGIDQQFLAKYTVKRAFFAFLTLDDNGAVVKHSATYGS